MYLTFFRCYVFSAYFLEDVVELLDFEPPAEDRKRKKNKKEDDDAETAVEGDENMNNVVSEKYSEVTRRRVASLSEKDISFELIEVKIKIFSYRIVKILP